MNEPPLEAAYRAYFPLIREKCRRMLGDSEEAKDVAQETFIRLWQGGQGSEGPRQVSAWVYRTSTRLAIDCLRRRRTREGLAPEEEQKAPDLEESLHLRRQLRQLAGEVPADELEVVLLSRLDGMTHEEVAEVASVSDRTVRRMLRRFDERLTRLREELSA